MSKQRSVGGGEWWWKIMKQSPARAAMKMESSPEGHVLGAKKGISYMLFLPSMMIISIKVLYGLL